VLNRKGMNQSPTNRTKSKSVKQYVSIEDLGIPLDLSFLKSVSSYKDTDRFGTVAECTLDEVRREFFNLKSYKKRSIEEVKEAISKCSKVTELVSKYGWAYDWCKHHNKRDLYKNLEVRKLGASIEEVKEAVSKCSTRNDLESNYRWAYRWICKNNRKDLIEHLMTNKVRTESEVKNVFDNWKGTKTQFTNTHKAEASWAMNRGLWVEWSKGFVNPKVDKYTLTGLKEAISKSSSYTEFKNNYSGYFQWAYRTKNVDLVNSLRVHTTWKWKRKK
jgi:hypothetical protein